MTPAIPFIRPTFPHATDVAQAYEQIVESNWFTNFGPFERRLAAAMGAHLGDGLHVSTFGNATLALVGAISVVLGRGDGSRCVLVPSFTFVAGPQALLWAGYRPAFIDIDRHSWQPSIASARELVATRRADCAGILLCNTLGTGNEDIADWEQFAEETGLPLVIDSAAGFGSDYSASRPVGVAGACEVFSMHATKPFGIGEGGAVVSHDPGVVAALDRFQNFGFGPDRDSSMLGLNAKLPEISAAIGLLQLDGLTSRLRGRRATLQAYQEAFEPLGITVLPNSGRSALGCASVRATSPHHRDALLASLTSAGVGARSYYNPPVHRQGHFLQDGSLHPVVPLDETEALCAEVISLPIHDQMADADVERVIEAVISCR